MPAKNVRQFGLHNTYIPHYTIQTNLYPTLHHTNTPISPITPYKHTYLPHYTIQTHLYDTLHHTNLYPTLHHRNTPIPPPHNTNLYPTIHHIHKPTSHTTPYKQTCTPHYTVQRHLSATLHHTNKPISHTWHRFLSFQK